MAAADVLERRGDLAPHWSELLEFGAGPRTVERCVEARLPIVVDVVRMRSVAAPSEFSTPADSVDRLKRMRDNEKRGAQKIDEHGVTLTPPRAPDAGDISVE